MARYICPSCGAEFNGKKCKNCNYEALEWGQPTQPHPVSPEQILYAPYSQVFPSSHPDHHASRKRRKKRKLIPRKALLIVLGVIVAINLLQYGLFLASRRLYERNSHSYTALPDATFPDISFPDADLSDITLPVWEAPTVPSLSNDDYELLYEDDDFTVRACCQNMHSEGFVTVEVQNRTKRAISLFAENIVLNHRLADDESYLYIEVPKEDTGVGTFYLGSVCEGLYIYPTEVSCNFYAFDTKNYDTCFATDTITLHAPDGEMVPVPLPEGTPVWQGEDAQLLYMTWQDLEWFPGYLKFGMINDTDRFLSFYCDGALINGQEASASMFCTLPPHTVAYSTVLFYDLEAELNITSLDQLTSVELQMGVYDELAPDGIITIPPFDLPIP